MDTSNSIPNSPLVTILYIAGIALLIYWLFKSGPPEGGAKS